MAEFCLTCWNRIGGTNDKRTRYRLSWRKELCEGCGTYQRVIITERLCYRAYRHLTDLRPKRR